MKDKNDPQTVSEVGRESRCLDLLCRIAEAGGAAEPRANPQARHGYDFPTLSEAREADLNLLTERHYLDRTFVDRVSLCPGCGSHHLNLREICPGCGRPHLASEALLRHQGCGYVGRMTEFAAGAQIDSPVICPRCYRALSQSSADHAQVGRIFVCHECGLAVEEPPVEAHCLVCSERIPAQDLSSIDFFRYVLSPLGRLAVQRGMLLDEEEELRVLGGGRIYPPLVMRELLEEETRRLSQSRLSFWVLLIECGNDASRAAWLRLLREKLRDVDIVGQLSERVFVAMLPQTRRRGAEALRRRILSELGPRPGTTVTPLKISAPQQLDTFLAQPASGGRRRLAARA